MNTGEEETRFTRRPAFVVVFGDFSDSETSRRYGPAVGVVSGQGRL
ncbi:MAG: hypothetical protein ACREMY_27815 [bacterium]